jgi:putative membrane protein
MVLLIVNWVAGALALLLLANVFPGFRAGEFLSVLFAAGVVALISATVAPALRWAASTRGLVLSGGLLAVVDTFVFRGTALMVPGFAMEAFYPAVAGALLLLAVHLLVLHFMPQRDAENGPGVPVRF